MLRKDYIQRQFEEFGRVLALILGYKKRKEWDKFEQELQEASKKFLSLEINALEKLSVDEFQQQILLNENLGQTERKILASLLFEKLSLHPFESEPEKFTELKNKCLALYQNLQENFTNNEFDLDVYYKLELLRKM